MNIINRLCLLLFLSILSVACDIEHPPTRIILSDRIVDDYIKEMKNEYGICCFGRGGGYIDKINLISLDFQVKKPMSREEMRDLIVKASENLLKRFNENEEIRPYLRNYPFTFKNISIALSLVYDPQSDAYDDENKIALAILIKGNILYQIRVRDKLVLKEIAREPYEEAFRLVME